jgi:hypothetical protein
VNLPIDFGNRIDVQHAILAALFDDLRSKCAQALAVDAAVDDHVRDMDALGSVFSRHALCDHAQTGLGRREVSIARLAAQACRGPGEDDRAAAERDESPRGFAPDQKAAEAADPPEILELPGGHFPEIDPPIVPGIVDDQIDRVQARAWRDGLLEQPGDVTFARRIRHDRLGAATFAEDRVRNLVDLAAGPSGDQDVISLRGKPPAQRRAEPLLGADADNDRAGLLIGLHVGVLGLDHEGSPLSSSPGERTSAARLGGAAPPGLQPGSARRRRSGSAWSSGP